MQKKRILYVAFNHFFYKIFEILAQDLKQKLVMRGMDVQFSVHQVPSRVCVVPAYPSHSFTLLLVVGLMTMEKIV